MPPVFVHPSAPQHVPAAAPAGVRAGGPGQPPLPRRLGAAGGQGRLPLLPLQRAGDGHQGRRGPPLRLPRPLLGGGGGLSRWGRLKTWVETSMFIMFMLRLELLAEGAVAGQD